MPSAGAVNVKPTSGEPSPPHEPEKSSSRPLVLPKTGSWLSGSRSATGHSSSTMPDSLDASAFVLLDSVASVELLDSVPSVVVASVVAVVLDSLDAADVPLSSLEVVLVSALVTDVVVGCIVVPLVDSPLDDDSDDALGVVSSLHAANHSKLEIANLPRPAVDKSWGMGGSLRPQSEASRTPYGIGDVT